MLARVQPSLIGPYLKQRDDYNSSSLYRLLDERSGSVGSVFKGAALAGSISPNLALSRSTSVVATSSSASRHGSTSLAVPMI